MRLFAFALALSGCGLIHSVERDPPAPVALPDAFSLASTSSVARGFWWTTFGDRNLDGLIGHVFQENLDLKRAYSRLDQFMALEFGADAALWPQLSYDAQYSRSRNVFTPQIPAVTSDQFVVSLAASYEIDLWGRVHNTRKAAEMDAIAVKLDIDSLAITLSAQVAETWFQILEQRARRTTIEEQIRVNQTYLELVELRFGQGLASGLDVLQQRQQLASTRSELPQIESRTQVLENQLSVLLGRAPIGTAMPGIQGPNALPDPPPLPELGLPSTLLANRPDVRAAQMRVVSADHRIGAAIADMFPAIRLTGSVGSRSFDIKDLFSDFIWNIAAGLTGPLFDGGRRLAEIERTYSVQEEQLAVYGQAVLTAVREVEDALIQEKKQRAFLEQIRQQVELARTTLDEARSRYSNGLSDYLPVLTALRSLQALEQAEVSAERQLLSYRIQLYRALGGSWAQEVERPPMLSAAQEDEK